MSADSRLQELLQTGALRPDDLAELERLASGQVVLEALQRTPPTSAEALTERRFRDVADSAPVLLWLADEHGAVFFLNKAYLAFTNKPLQEMLGMGWTKWLHPDDAEPYVAQFLECFGRRERFEAQCRFMRWDGEYRWLNTVGVPYFENGSFIGYIGSSSDVTDIKSAEEALRERHRWFAEIVDVLPGILWVTDADGRCAYLSHGWYELTGQTTEEGWGDGWLDMIHPEDRSRTAAAFSRGLANRARFDLEYRLRVRSGEYRWCLDQGAPRFDHAGNFLGHVGQVIDISARKEAELVKAQASRVLKEANQRKDEFLALLAHELRNPLAPISAGLHILRSAPGSDAAHRALAAMERQVGNMVRLIDDLMDIARITRGHIELRKERVDLRSVVERAGEAVHPPFDARGQRLELRLPHGPVPVEVDPVRITQVVTNLLTNASRYSLPGSHVDLDLHCEAQSAVLTVTDPGIGIPPDRVEAVFEMFSPLNTELGRPHAGLGIGLAFSRKLVEMHGGTLSAHSEGTGRGARFTMTLALADAAGPAAALPLGAEGVTEVPGR